MKLLLVTEFFPASPKLQFTGGVEARSFYTARHMAAKDKVLLICRKTKKLVNGKKLGNLTVYPCGPEAKKAEASFLSMFGRILFMLAAFKKGLSLKFDLVEGSNVTSFLPAFLIACFKKKPVLAWYPDILGKDWFNFFGLTGFFGWLLESLSLKLNWTRVIALSKETEKKLLKKGVKKEKIKVVYGGVDLEFIKKIKVNENRKKLIICISRLVAYKKVNDLIRAFNLIIKKYPDWKLLIVGKGPEKQKLQSLTSFYNLEDKVVFLQNLSRQKIMELLQQSRLFCLPSIVEGFGLVTIEAAACQTPFIVADIPVNKEITYNGKGGLLFKKEDIKDLANKIEKMITDKNLYLKKQKQGVSLAQNYNWPLIVRQTRKIYQEAL